AANPITPADWLVIAAYFAALVGTGAYFAWRARRLASASAFFAGDHTMPVWAVAVSILATAQSAATFTGVPEQGYKGDLRYLATNLGSIVAAIILARVFIPAYYRKNVTTPYQLLESRFGRGAKLATSIAYMIGRVFASGARVYVGAIPVSMALFGDISPQHLGLSIAAFMAFGIVYTLAGGINSVIWTDVLQVCVYLGAALAAIIWLCTRVTVPWSEVLAAVHTGTRDGTSKLNLWPNDWSWSTDMNLATILTGFVLLALASHGTDQDLVQRMLTCRSAAKGSWSVISGVLIGIPAVAMFSALGVLLWVYYQHPGMMGDPGRLAPAGETSGVFLQFILSEMPPGFAGLMIAGVLAAGPAGINSSLNSMGSTLVNDVYRSFRPNRTDRHYIVMGRWAIAFWGIVLWVFALACIPWRARAGQDIINFVLSVMNFAYAGLLGVFFTALFTRRGNTASCIAAMFVGFTVVLLLRAEVWTWWTTELGLKGWSTFKLAWPWHLVLGAAAATATAAAPRGFGRA
ncbi:MAG: sodium:solute symporter, partial [Phycisphaerales bacterium]